MRFIRLGDRTTTVASAPTPGSEQEDPRRSFDIFAMRRPTIVLGRATGVLVLLVSLILCEVDGTAFLTTSLQQIAVNSCLGLAVVVLLGYAGELSFAYGILFGTGGYVSWELMVHGVPVWPAIVLGVVASMALGGVIALPALRIRGLQVALATFGAGVAGIEIFQHLSGGAGVVLLPTVRIAGASLGITDPTATAIVALVVLALVFAACEFLVGGRLGRRWLLMKADESTARSFGTMVGRERVVAFVLSSALLGAIGALYPTILGLLSPTPYGFQTVINVLIIALIGGMLSPGGALLGAVIFQLLSQEVTRAPAGLSQVVYGLLLLLLLRMLPRGLIGLLDSVTTRLTDRRRHPQPAAQTTVADDSVGAAMLSDPGRHGPPVADRPNLLINRPPSSAILGCDLRGEGLTRYFGAFCAVDNVDISVEASKVTGVIGANGAGKSTLLDLLTGFQAPNQGSVSLTAPEGFVPLAKLSGPARAQSGVIRTFQQAQLVPDLSVEDNIRVALEIARGGKHHSATRVFPSVSSVINLAGLAPYRTTYPAKLPFGVVKLVDVARLVVAGPRIALLDEPAAGLGGGELHVLEGMIRYLVGQGIAVLLIEHNLDFVARVADYLYVMDFGTILVSGEPTSVLSSPEVLEAYSLQANIGGVSHGST